MNIVDPLLCTYVIEESGFTEAQGLDLAASMGAYWLESNKDAPLLHEWLDSGHRKHFRRAKPNVFEKLQSELPSVVLEQSGLRLWASPLTRFSEIPKIVKKLQMSNFSFVEDNSYISKGLVTVRVNETLEMSFGKAAVAAAHATQELVRRLEVEDSNLLDIWKRTGYSTTVARGNLIEVSGFQSAIEDFGLTEVPAGSITAQAFLRN